jgi:hypothetical protein
MENHAEFEKARRTTTYVEVLWMGKHSRGLVEY